LSCKACGQIQSARTVASGDGSDAPRQIFIGRKPRIGLVSRLSCPNSQFQDEYSLKDILESPMVYDPLTKLQCCPTSDGGAAAVLASQRFAYEHDMWNQAVEITDQAMTTDFESTFRKFPK
jgi:hypothetical protein